MQLKYTGVAPSRTSDRGSRTRYMALLAVKNALVYQGTRRETPPRPVSWQNCVTPAYYESGSRIEGHYVLADA